MGHEIRSCQRSNIREAEHQSMIILIRFQNWIKFGIRCLNLPHVLSAQIRQGNGASFVEFIASHFHQTRDYITADIGKCYQ